MRSTWFWASALALVLWNTSGLAPADEQDKAEKVEQPAKPDGESQIDEEAMIRLLIDAVDHIERSYVDEVDRDKLFEAAVEGVLRKLKDPYSSYIDQGHFEDFRRATEGEFGGIGISIGNDPEVDMPIIISPLPGTPGARAGLRAGDHIAAIEGEETHGMTPSQVVSKLTGQIGTDVTFTIKREGQEPFDVTITRDTIREPSVMGDTRNTDGTWNFMIDPEHKIAYFRLRSFIPQSASDLQDALEEAKADGLRGLVLDLRANPGGLLRSAVEIADMFIKQGRIVSTKGRNTPEQKWNATGRAVFADLPMAVLVDGFSASASEILAAALKDNQRAKIVGTRTFGKGSVQNVVQLPGGERALKITTAYYYRPNGHNIHRAPGAKEEDEWGVHPDDGYEVEMSRDELRQYIRYRSRRDVPNQEPDEEDKQFKDKQLEKALEYLRSVLENPNAKAA